MITLIEREDINDKKWNGCIHFGFNGLPYAYTWYLDIVCENWKGLVYKDYEAVFPLVWNNKWGVNYLHQPHYSQQHGIFSLDPLSKNEIVAFFEAIPIEYRYMDIQVNAANWRDDAGIEKEARPNYVLDLNRPYEEIASRYSGNIKRNLKKSERSEIRITNQISPEDFAKFYLEHTAPKVRGFSEKRYYMLTRIIYNSFHYNVSFISGAMNKENELIAACFFLFNQKFIINLAPATNEEGRSCGAMVKLIDYVIRLNEMKPVILDFEGSSIPSIAKFYGGFGSKKVSYYRLRRNSLPWYLKLIKK